MPMLRARKSALQPVREEVLIPNQAKATVDPATGDRLITYYFPDHEPIIIRLNKLTQFVLRKQIEDAEKRLYN